jgi:hypothetical protein
MSRYARVIGIRPRRTTRRRSRRAANRATARRAAWTTRPISSAIVTSVGSTEGLHGWRHTEARVSKSEHYAVEINPPDDRLDHPGIPVRRKEIDPPSRALRESFRKADFGPAGAQVDQRKSQQPAFARFKDNGPPAGPARIAPQLRLPWRAPAGLVGEHGGWAYRRHRASGKPVCPLGLSSRAILALSTGLPSIGFAMLEQSPRIPNRTLRRGGSGSGWRSTSSRRGRRPCQESFS